jgi:predicted DNA-binding transcriptional regulator AlpA
MPNPTHVVPIPPDHSPVPSATPAAGFLRLPEVLRLYPVSRSTWLAGVRAGKFPKPVKLSPNCTAWRATDIAELCARAAAGQAVRA